jgi:glycosyltransferase involved in cell wall biosynthesis
MRQSPALISVVTPVHAPVREHLAAAYESLRTQVLPVGWQWQWVVQEDGQSGKLARFLPDDGRISSDSGRRSGETATRNLCLSRARGELVKVLDADDQLMPGTLAREIGVLTTHEDIGWTTAKALDLLPDGSTAEFAENPPEGRIERGAVLRFWKAHDFTAQVHPATLCIRRKLLFALGGWMALPASGDTGLLLAASVLTPGYFIDAPGLLYRKWPGQMTSQVAHHDPAERSARMAIIGERAETLAELSASASALRSSGCCRLRTALIAAGPRVTSYPVAPG